MPSSSRSKLTGADGRLLRGYAPLVGLIVLYALIVLLTPTVAREKIVASGGASGAGAVSAGALPGDGIAGAPGGATPAASGGVGTGGAAATPGGTTTSCGPQQVPGDPYSPPCLTWSGDNGGATYPGVTADSIRMSVRLTTDPGLQAILSQLQDQGLVTETEADVRRTAFGLVDYFNAHFQLFGRKIAPIEFQGRGSALNETLGGGQDLANADAIKAAQELHVFADASAFTPPYADALSKQGVMAFGAPYLSRKWFNEHAPYVWSIVPDCSRLAELNIAAYTRLLAGRPAEYAGGDLKDKPRTLAVIAPNSPAYQECVDDGLALLKSSGGGDALRLDYTLDPGSLSAQAGNLIDQLKSHNITSVALGTDPLLPLFLTQKAKEQGYFPEWLVLGTALTDSDLVGQLYDQEEWSHAFGVSQLGVQGDYRASPGYQAYKSVHPESEPSITVDLLYYQLYQVALGIQLAGPNLTPQTYAQGMFGYAGGSGLAGTWRFGPGDYTGQDDGVIIWWDTEGTSEYDHKKGRYVQVGDRFTAATAPSEPPRLFNR